ncbi:SGT1 protein-domain-containing protein [Limtongia smithiae]|uniref:SGT1 protein-domain-containing protein n=1 Tax=Limtongia smithiae TaxID=1125753 RepID=UPI0034CE0658
MSADAPSSSELPSEDTLVVRVYHKDPAAPVSAAVATLTVFREAVAATTISVAGSSYIWQRQRLSLRLVASSDSPHLFAQVDYGASVEDEWLAVHILREQSKKFNDVAVQVVDSDGEFLLIEAADALPRWLDPDNAINRVWLLDGALVILADSSSSSKYGPLDLATARRMLHTPAASTSIYSSDNLQQAAFARLSIYPTAAVEHMHCAEALIPRSLAQILREKRTLVAPATEAFLLRDPVSMKACTKMSRFPPTDSVKVTVSFSRLMYAQLQAQRIQPPQAFSALLPEDDAPEFAAVELGMKLACGFELLCANASADAGDFDEVPETDEYALFENEFKEYYGYPLDEASNGIQQILCLREFKQYRLDESYSLPNQAKDIVAILPLLPHLSDADIARANDAAGTPDSDSWLNVDMREFDAKLESCFIPPPEAADDADVTDGNNDDEGARIQARNILDRLSKFMSDTHAGLDGIEFDEDDVSSDGSEQSGEEEEEQQQEEEEQEEEEEEQEEEEEKEQQQQEDDDDGNSDEIDEDDFFEFFLKDALKLPPEEIEKFRATTSSSANHSTRRRSAGASGRGFQAFSSGISQLPVALSSRIVEANSSDDDGDNDNDFDASDEEISDMRIRSRFASSASSSDDDADIDIVNELRDRSVLSGDEASGDTEARNLQILQNLLASITSQDGGAGPSSNLLARLGIS